ncbi:ATP-dependent helicase [Pseudoalteromonas sp. SWYJZ98]|uniref:UvrD-helicase domain-containing protein n=1 Tax=Pseudoalteromonas sp. SWYJZ98 TaxID=2792060 RepID=UPI0018CF8368|nr:ATP-dependent helicase [Pseudoalteromonas sp. SWYJZ98]MBH0029811.1 ATP-dependent helicase [Pseudoalteromonas sp. SWYJZ98]
MVEWKPSLGIEATDELMDIINFEGSLSVLAGAGAGKTELLAQKANYLFATNKCSWPKRILSLTFKTEAQENIKKRIDRRCGQKSERFDSFTFHGFCKSIIDRFKNILNEAERPTDNYDIVLKQAEANGSDKILMSELPTLALKIIAQREDIKSIFSMSYEYVFVDEFQDTTNQQYSLLKQLFCNTTTKIITVGDVNQSIMLWAGARPSVFTDFSNDFAAEKMLLLKNHRASIEVQNVLNVVLEFVEGAAAPLTVLQEPPTNCTVHLFSDELQEAQFIANEIQCAIQGGIKESEICVLTKQHSAEYTELLRSELTRLSINNLEMSDLQDALKEPLGRIFSLFLKAVVCPEPKVITELYDIYRSLNRVELGDDKEAEFTSLIANFISEKQNTFTLNATIENIISDIQSFIHFLGVQKIKGRWKQYKSPAYYSSVLQSLELHFRDMYVQSGSIRETAQLFTADNAVQIMNIHKCKGLEYQSVYLMGLEDQAFWKYKNEPFENNCAIYVALSRAKEKIYVTYCCNREHRVTQWHDNRNSTYNSVKPVFDLLLDNCKFQAVNHIV